MGANHDPGSRMIELLERLGNRLPDPATFFLGGTVVIMLASAVAAATGWEVTGADQQVNEPIELPAGARVSGPFPDADGNPIRMLIPADAATGDHLGEADEEAIELPAGARVSGPIIDAGGDPIRSSEPTTFRAKSLLTSKGLHWAISSMIDNFMEFPPLGIVLVTMLGIGIAERTGLLGAVLKRMTLGVPSGLLAPAVVFIGIMSSLSSDAGYVVLPPLAAAIYCSAGRSPIAGLAAVFAGVSGGFSANLILTSLDPLLAGYTNIGAAVIEPDYEVKTTANLYFMVVSTVVITLVGWGVTELVVERRFRDKAPDEGGPVPPTQTDVQSQHLEADEKTALKASLIAAGIVVAIVGLMAVPAAGPLHGQWDEALVQIIFAVFAVAGIVYGITTRQIRNDKQVAKLLVDSMAAMGPIIVMAFFAAQFIEYFSYSGLDTMLALTGGRFIAALGMPASLLIVAFIGVTLIFNLLIGSMSAKYALFAPIFVPILMTAGISPELTQVAYRIGDSVSNVITPMNYYFVFMLAILRKYVPRGGMGTLIATMLPYSVAFTVAWTTLLLIWMWIGLPLGPESGLTYTPAG